MSAKSRNKGAAAEREVAAELFQHLGVTFSRNLRQYQECNQGDLICDNPDFPFVIEVKRYAKGWTCKPSWMVQAQSQAVGTDKHAAVAYRFDGQQWRFRVWFDALAEAFGTHAVAGQFADLDIQGFAWACREIMAWRADPMRCAKAPRLMDTEIPFRGEIS